MNGVAGDTDGMEHWRELEKCEGPLNEKEMPSNIRTKVTTKENIYIK